MFKTSIDLIGLLRMSRLSLLSFGFAVATVSPSLAQSARPEVLPIVCQGPAGAAYNCLLSHGRALLSEAVGRANAYITASSLSCAYDLYRDWERSIGGLKLMQSQVNSWARPLAGGVRAEFVDLSRAVDVEILNSRFAIADASLRNGGRYCRKYADAEYRRILADYQDPAFQFARDRAKVGIDDVRALPPLPDQ